MIFHVSFAIQISQVRSRSNSSVPKAHSYQYTFSPNPHWSNLYAPGKEIQQYLQGVAEKFGATRFIKTSHRVEKCAWNADEKRW